MTGQPMGRSSGEEQWGGNRVITKVLECAFPRSPGGQIAIVKYPPPTEGNFREPGRQCMFEKEQLSWRASSKASRSTGKFHPAGWDLYYETLLLKVGLGWEATSHSQAHVVNTRQNHDLKGSISHCTPKALTPFCGFTPNCFYFLCRSTLPISKKLKVPHLP